MAARKPEIRGQESLFVPSDTPPKKRVVTGNGKPVWTRYRPQKAKAPHKCDYCCLNQVDDPSAPAARLAQYKRTVVHPDGTREIRYLCSPHTNDQRSVDGVKPVQTRTP